MAGYDCTFVFCFNDTATTEIYTLSLHDALPIWWKWRSSNRKSTCPRSPTSRQSCGSSISSSATRPRPAPRSEEHTSELQSQSNLVCRLLLEKKKNNTNTAQIPNREQTTTIKSSK